MRNINPTLLCFPVLLFILDINLSGIEDAFLTLFCYLFAGICLLTALGALIYLFRGTNSMMGKALAACCFVSSIPGLFMESSTYDKFYPIGFLPFLSFFAGLCILYKLRTKKDQQ